MTDVINAISLHRCADDRHRIRFKAGDQMRSLTLAELDEKATAVARRLRLHGIQPRDRVGVMSRNCLAWVLLDLAVLKLGAVTAGFEIGRFEPMRAITDYGLKMLFAEGVPDNGPLRDIGAVEGWAVHGTDSGVADPDDPPFHAGYDPADICAIKLTSGSTGGPKGLERTVASVNSSLTAVQDMFGHGEGDNILVFLPLAYLQQRFWVYSALVNSHDITIAEAEDAEEMARATSPTVIMGVPGFYEDLKARFEAAVMPADPSDRRGAIQERLGARIRYLWTGSAPASQAVLEFFNNNGVPLYEGYGLSETCIVAKNHPGAFRLGSVGKVLPDKTVRFDKDGILIVGSRYPINCRYTWCAPGASEKVFLPTAEVKTFDLGHVDEDGFLYIYGRVDDVLSLSSGLNVLATLIEEKVCEHPQVHGAVLYGNGKGFLSVIISPASPEIDHTSLRDHIDKLNDSSSEEQHILGVVVATERFSIENGMLTAQYKPKRQEIYRRHAKELMAIYKEG